ncbi:GTP-binding protein 8 [Trichoplax sp. H2]|nr:GTP-binding protein 8 [Trichoplax sp. H2]|eukprot:RDD45868.1 GTP-binding protein 8 [Trichoplax sp. H2]
MLCLSMPIYISPFSFRNTKRIISTFSSTINKLNHLNNRLDRRLYLPWIYRWSSSYAFRERDVNPKHSYSYLLEGYPIIFEPNQKELTKAQKLFTKGNNKFVTSVMEFEQLDRLPYTLPEIAFIGRSNAGKSTLINAIACGGNRFARTSKKPGHTRLLNFYSIANKLFLVDTPGYGYRSPKYFEELVQRYTVNRTRLRNSCLLIDSRHGFKSNDLEALAVMEDYGLSYQIVLTKVDCVTRGNMLRLLSDVYEIVHKTNCCLPQVFPVSAKRRKGLAELRCFIASTTNQLT